MGAVGGRREGWGRGALALSRNPAGTPPMGDPEALTFALFALGRGASRRHLFAGCGASRLITLPAA